MSGQVSDANFSVIGGASIKKGSDDDAQDKVVSAIIGALILIILVIVLTSAWSPDGDLKYRAVLAASPLGESEGFREMRTSVALQTVMLITGLVVAGLFYAECMKTSPNLGLGALGFVAAATLGLVFARPMSFKHLNWFFGILAVLYAVVSAMAIYAGVKIMLGSRAKIRGILMIAVGVFFLLSFVAAIMVAKDVITGDEAKDAADLVAAAETLVEDAVDHS
jgi:hypothetical protein